MIIFVAGAAAKKIKAVPADAPAANSPKAIGIADTDQTYIGKESKSTNRYEIIQ